MSLLVGLRVRLCGNALQLQVALRWLPTDRACAQRWSALFAGTKVLTGQYGCVLRPVIANDAHAVVCTAAIIPARSASAKYRLHRYHCIVRTTVVRFGREPVVMGVISGSKHLAQRDVYFVAHPDRWMYRCTAPPPPKLLCHLQRNLATRLAHGQTFQ